MNEYECELLVGWQLSGGKLSIWRTSCPVVNLVCSGIESRPPHVFMNGVWGQHNGKVLHKWNCFCREQPTFRILFLISVPYTGRHRSLSGKIMSLVLCILKEITRVLNLFYCICCNIILLVLITTTSALYVCVCIYNMYTYINLW